MVQQIPCLILKNQAKQKFENMVSILSVPPPPNTQEYMLD